MSARDSANALRFRYARRLSRREAAVLQSLADGNRIVTAAAGVGITPHAARYALRTACDKLGARSRSHAIAVGLVVGAIDPPIPGD